MKKQTSIILAALAATTLHAAAQGSLTPPPGVPGPVMKSLDQIEARTPISAAPYNITQPGSYYLTGNLEVASGDAIQINASGVTLDLNGFSIITTNPSVGGVGIHFFNGQKDITVTNGHIRGSITFDGTSYSGGGFSLAMGRTGNDPQNVLISHVTASGCSTGIFIGASSVSAISCSVHTITNNGIACRSVENCLAYDCGNGLVAASAVSNCVATATGSGTGISALNVTNSFGNSVTGVGINCTAATNSTGLSTSGNGMNATIAQNCFGRTTSGSRGLNVTGTASYCRGRNDAVSGVAIQAAIAVGCTAEAGTITSPQKHLGTP